MFIVKPLCHGAIAALCALCVACTASTAAKPPTVAAPSIEAPSVAAPSAEVSPSSPEGIVEGQLAAFNRRDLEGFLGFYADDAVLLKYPDQVTHSGKDALRTRYQRTFKNLNVRAAILKRVTIGRFVVDRERITAPPAAGAIEAVAIYEVKDGKIARVTFLEP
jgi:hypothetical protein